MNFKTGLSINDDEETALPIGFLGSHLSGSPAESELQLHSVGVSDEAVHDESVLTLTSLDQVSLGPSASQIRMTDTSDDQTAENMVQAFRRRSYEDQTAALTLVLEEQERAMKHWLEQSGKSSSSEGKDEEDKRKEDSPALRWFLGPAFHRDVEDMKVFLQSTLLADCEGLLVDPGAFDNLTGSRWVERMSAMAAEAGQVVKVICCGLFVAIQEFVVQSL